MQRYKININYQLPIINYFVSLHQNLREDNILVFTDETIISVIPCHAAIADVV